MSKPRIVRTPGESAAVDEPATAAEFAGAGASVIPEPKGKPGRPPRPQVVASSGSIPNAIDIDPRAIRGPVLTRQGYVLPDEAWQKANPDEFKKLAGIA